MQIQEVTELLGIPSYHQQQAAMDLGPEMASEVILAINKLDGVAAIRLGHAMYLTAKLFQ